MSIPTGKILAVVLGGALVGGFLWSQRPHPPHAAEASGAAARTVRAVEVLERAVPLHVEALGTLRSGSQVAIAARVAAEVREVRVDAGAAVRAGERLIELEAAGPRAGVALAEAQVAVAQQTLEEARREEQRTRTLFEGGARTSQELDAAVTRLAGAEAGARAAEQGLSAARAGLDDALLVAPFDGVVSSRSVDPGDLASPGRVLLELYDPTDLRLEVAVPERLLAGLAAGDTLAFAIDALGDARAGLRAPIAQIRPGVDAATRTGIVELALPELPGALPGMFGRALLPDGERQAVVVPRAALVERGQLQLVFTVGAEGRQARMQLVRAGRAVGADEVEILSGLGGGQRVLVEGLESLHDGAPIRVLDGAPGAR